MAKARALEARGADEQGRDRIPRTGEAATSLATGRQGVVAGCDPGRHGPAGCPDLRRRISRWRGRYPAADEEWRSYQGRGHGLLPPGGVAPCGRRVGRDGHCEGHPRLHGRWVSVGGALRTAGRERLREETKKAWSEAVALGEHFFGLRATAWLDGGEDAWSRGRRKKAPSPEEPTSTSAPGIERLARWAKQARWNLPPPC